MNISLDIGAHEMRALWHSGNQLHSRHCRSACLMVENTDNQRTLLEQMEEPFIDCGEKLAIVGESAVRVATLLRRPLINLFPDGRLPGENPAVRQLIAAIIESLLGRPKPGRNLCAVTLPGVTKKGTSLEAEEKRHLIQMVRLLGYQPLHLNAPYGLVLATLSDHAFSGIGMTCGAATTELSVVHNSREVAHCAVPYAGTWIDHRLARENEKFVWDASGRKHLDTEQVRSWKENNQTSLVQPSDLNSQQLSDICRGMLTHALQQAVPMVRQAIIAGQLDGPLPLVISGGTTQLPGFANLLSESLEAVDFPVVISELRMEHSDYAVARGGLIHAELEADAATPPLAA
ncbi:MAG: hypothetical protein Tsb009_39510 [Planctomycetaceae bacterium]